MVFSGKRRSSFFDTREDLLYKIRYYLNHPDQVKKIALAGYRRCVDSGYDHHNRMRYLLQIVNDRKIKT
ncbi:MAG: glycosyltransferase family 1 protein [Lewinellaceae bacterium]|nr:glycosyltransferase family 1 protein [Lewinellaceae bacterium]